MCVWKATVMKLSSSTATDTCFKCVRVCVCVCVRVRVYV